MGVQSQVCVTAPAQAATGDQGVQPGVRLPSQPLLTTYSQLATIFKPAPLDTSSTVPATNCPHLWSGLSNWHDPTIWPNNQVPAAGADVTLPTGIQVLVSACSWPPAGYHSVWVPATTTLIINDQNMTLTFTNMRVDGSLYLGSQTCRVYSHVDFNFVGDCTGPLIAPNMGTKGIGVSGSFDVHGEQYHPTWTRLAVPAQAGEDCIYLDDEVNWKSGQEFFVTTSDYNDIQQFGVPTTHQNEVRTIVSVSEGGRRICFNETLMFNHYAGPEYQCEVGLLSRNIRFIGNPGPTNCGGHTLIHGSGRYSGVQAIEMGQQNVMARYPFHFHLGGEKPQNFVHDCSCKSSMFRCVTIHGTNSTQVTRNVAYNCAGNTFYIEDGVEEKNEISFNLAAHSNTIGTPSSGAYQGGETFTTDSITLQPVDHSAAGFYITNANNVIVGNAASGGWTGFSFPNFFAVYGPALDVWPIQYNTSSFVPCNRPLARFEGNSAHSAGHVWGSGSCMYVGGTYSEPGGVATYNSGRGNSRSPKLDDGTTSWMKWSNIRVWLCNKGINHWGDRVVIEKFEAHDCSRGAVLFGDSVISDCIFDADSGNPINQNEWETDAFSFYDTAVRTVIYNCSFNNYNGSRSVALRATTPADVFKPEGIAAISASKFVNTPVNNKVDPGTNDQSSARYYQIKDWDGSFTGTGVKTLIGASTNTSTSDQLGWWDYCRQGNLQPWYMWACPMDTAATIEVAHLYIQIPNEIGNYRNTGVNDPANSAHIGRMYLWGPNIPDAANRYTLITKNPGVTGVIGVGGWYMDMQQNMQNVIQIRPQTIPYARSLIFAVGYPSGSTFSISQMVNGNTDPTKMTAFTAASSYNDLFTGTGKTYFFDGQHLFLKIVSALQSDTYFSWKGVKLYDQMGWSCCDIIVTATCPNGNCYTPTNIPSGLNAVPAVDTTKLKTADIVLPSPDPPALKDVFESASGATVAVPSGIPAGWQWVTVVDPSAALDMSQWAYNGLPVPAADISQCGSQGQVIRNASGNGYLTWTMTLPQPATQVNRVRVSFTYGFIDSWSGSTGWGYLYINGAQAWTQNQGRVQTGSDTCGLTGTATSWWYYDSFSNVVTSSALLDTNTVQLNWTSSNPANTNQKTFSVGQVKIEVLTQTGSGSVVDCQYGDWSAWAPNCPNDCTVVQTRSRSIATPATNGGTPCVSYNTMAKNCTCTPVNCQWSAYGPLSACDSTCHQTHTRSITVQAINGGAPCTGSATETLVCASCGACGNGLIEGTEQCDDSNTVSGDGCSSSCTNEYGWACTGQPSTCVRTVPVTSYLTATGTKWPTVVPVTGSHVVNIAYGAAVPGCVISVSTWAAGTWNWAAGNSLLVNPGMGTARIALEGTNLAAAVDIRASMSCNGVAATGSLIQTSIPTSSSIQNTNGPATSALPTAYTIDVSDLPTTVPVSGPFVATFDYCAPTNAHIWITLQGVVAPYTFYGNGWTTVPAGCGTTSISTQCGQNCPVPAGTPLGVSVVADADYYAHKSNYWSYTSFSAHTPLTYTAANAVAASDVTFTDSSANQQSSAPASFPVGELIGGMIVGCVVVLLVALVVVQYKTVKAVKVEAEYP